MEKIPAFGPWTEQNHIGKAPEGALSRAQLAETTPIQGSLDTVNQTARFYGSKVYDVSLSYCPCGGFHGKHPCKHIYRLAMELGIINLPFKTGISKGEYNETQIPSEQCIDIVEHLSENSQREMLRFLCGCTTSSRENNANTSFLLSEPALIEEFRQCPLFMEVPAEPSEILESMKRAALLSIIEASGAPNPPKKNISKETCISWLLENVPDLSRHLPLCVKFSVAPNFVKAQRSVYSHLVHKYER